MTTTSAVFASVPRLPGRLSGGVVDPTTSRAIRLVEDALAAILVEMATATVTTSSVTLPIAESDVTGLVADLAAKVGTARLISTGTGLSGGGDLSANRTISLANTAVTPGSYTYAGFTVDQQGRLTAASSGATPVATSRTLTATAPIRIDGGASADLSANRTLSVTSFAGSAPGAVPTSVGGTVKFLRADGSWAPVYLFDPLFGPGVDGPLHFDGVATVLGMAPSGGGTTYTLTRAIYPTDCIIDSGITVKLAGYLIIGTGTLSGGGTITDNGADGTAGSATAGGIGGAARAAGWYPANRAGGAGGVGGGASGSAPLPLMVTTAAAAGGAASGGGAGTDGLPGSGGTTAGQGGGGGGGGINVGGSGGAITQIAATGIVLTPFSLIQGWATAVAAQFTTGTGGGGGGGAAAGHAGGGGGGASGGYAVVVFAIIATITIQANGGSGGKGGDSGNAGDRGGGGGGAGGGGMVVVMYNTVTGTLTTAVNPGSVGSAGARFPTGSAGGAGGTGHAGVVVRINLSGDGT